MRNNIVVFWDFENIHSSVMTEVHGQSWYQRMGRGVQPEVIDIDAVMSYIYGLGDVIMNRAYCNWQWMRNYAGALNENAIDLVQLFPRGRHSKNGADISLAVDLVEILQRLDHVDTVFIIGGDSDFISVGKLVRQRGLKMIGIGVRETTNAYWIKTCNEFKFYGNLVRTLRTPHLPERQTLDVREARELLAHAVQQQSLYYGEEWVKQVRLKPAIVRLNSSFDEQDYGYPSFSVFLRDQSDLLERRHLPGEQEPEFRLLDDAPLRELAVRPVQIAPEGDRVRFYLRVAHQQGVRMPRPEIMWIGIDIYSQFVGQDGKFETFNDLDDETLRQLQEDFPDANLTDAKKIRQVLFKCYLFRPSEGDGIGFHEDVTGLEDIEDRYFRLMLDRIAGNLDEEIDYTSLSLALTGTEDQAVRLEKMDAAQLEN